MKHTCALLFCLFLWGVLITPVEAVSNAKTRIVVDMAGRHVRVPREIRRVVTAGGTPAVNAFLAVLGKGSLVVNGLPRQMRGERWKYQRLFIPAADGGPVVSGMGPSWPPDLETLRATPHDLVLVDNQQTAVMLEQRGFTVVCLLWRGPDSIRETIHLLGDILGRQKQAREYERYYLANQKKISRLVAGKSDVDRPRALFCRLDNLSLPMVSTARVLIERSGGVYGAKGEIPADHAVISLETLLAWDPDVLFVWSAEDVRRAHGDPRFATLKAVRQHRVFAIPMGMHAWSNYTPEQALALLWMASKLLPGKFDHHFLTVETRNFYRMFCGKTLSDDQIYDILDGANEGMGKAGH